MAAHTTVSGSAPHWNLAACGAVKTGMQYTQTVAFRGFKMRPAVLLLLFLAASANAENIIIPLGQQGSSTLQMPVNGTSRSSVLERFGLPDVEHPPVGSPRMTRWDYRDFSVYFENDRVITSVRNHQPRYPTSRPEQAQP